MPKAKSRIKKSASFYRYSGRTAELNKVRPSWHT